MAVWCHPCRRCGEEDTVWYVSELAVAELPRGVRIVRVRVGRRWLCARLDVARRIQAEGLLVRDVIPTDATDCGQCQDL